MMVILLAFWGPMLSAAPLRRRLYFGLIIALLLSSSPVHAAKPLTVFVSLAPQAFIVERVGGSNVDVHTMIPVTANHEDYEPGIAELRELSRATVYFFLGHPQFSFETVWLKRALAQERSVQQVDMSEGCAIDAEDPHLWTSLDCAAVMAKNVRAVLEKQLPTSADEFAANEKKFQEDLAVLRAELHTQLDRFAGRSFLIYHPAWGYFAREFRFEQIAIEVEGKESDAKQLSDVIAIAKARGIHTIFVQPQFPVSSAKLVAQEIGAQVVEFDPLQRDWFSAMRMLGKVLGKSFS